MGAEWEGKGGGGGSTTSYSTIEVLPEEVLPDEYLTADAELNSYRRSHGPPRPALGADLLTEDLQLSQAHRKERRLEGKALNASFPLGLVVWRGDPGSKWVLSACVLYGGIRRGMGKCTVLFGRSVFFDFGLWWGSRSRHGLFDGHVPVPASHHIAKLLVAVKVKHLQNLMASGRARCRLATRSRTQTHA